MHERIQFENDMKVELGEQYFRADFLLISGFELTLNLLSRKTKQNKQFIFLQIGSKTHQTVVDSTTAVTTVLSRINVAARTAPREQEEKNSAKINGVLVFCRSVGDIWTQNASLVIFYFPPV